jgi:hypothetical protein
VLIGTWTFAPLGGLLGHSEALVRFMTALGLLVGASAAWLVQYTLHRELSRHALTGGGWAASVLFMVALYRGVIAGPSALTHAALLIAHSGCLAWGLRLLLKPVGIEKSSDDPTRELLVGIKNITRDNDGDLEPRPLGRRITPVPPVSNGSSRHDTMPAIPRAGGKKADRSKMAW